MSSLGSLIMGRNILIFELRSTCLSFQLFCLWWCVIDGMSWTSVENHLDRVGKCSLNVLVRPTFLVFASMLFSDEFQNSFFLIRTFLICIPICVLIAYLFLIVSELFLLSMVAFMARNCSLTPTTIQNGLLFVSSPHQFLLTPSFQFRETTSYSHKQIFASVRASFISRFLLTFTSNPSHSTEYPYLAFHWNSVNISFGYGSGVLCFIWTASSCLFLTSRRIGVIDGINLHKLALLMRFRWLDRVPCYHCNKHLSRELWFERKFWSLLEIINQWFF